MALSDEDRKALKWCAWIAFAFLFIGGAAADLELPGMIGFLGLICMAAPHLIRHQKKQKVARDVRLATHRDELESAFRQVIARHKTTLLQRQRHLVDIDHYGGRDATKWHKEWTQFVEKHLLPYLPSTPFEGREAFINQLVWTAFDALQVELSREHVDGPRSSVDLHKMDPIEFEKYCASLLKKAGWKAQATQASGDQGIDVVATWGDFTSVFQCKRYQGTVGNDAVQQILSGRLFQKAQGAAVVCLTSYTKSARQLANETRVLLLVVEDLRRLSPSDFGYNAGPRRGPPPLRK